ncbi:MAG TPA: SagB family peptide dehydrogenase [Terracidiphilus sp.]|nr:SagB family peptide dehydrogenase [Terracidiphilus sp.]
MLSETAVNSRLSAIRLEKADDVSIGYSNGRWTVRGGGEPLFFRLPAGKTFAFLDEMRDGGVPLERLDRDGRADEAGGCAVEQLGRLWRQGRLVKAIYDGDERIAALFNFSDVELLYSDFDPSIPFVITEDTCLHREGDSAILETSASGAYLQILDTRILRISLPFFKPIKCEEWAAEVQVPENVIVALADCLHSIRVIEPAANSSASITQASGWSFANRMAHARSRVGRHIGQYGSRSSYPGRLDDPLQSSDPPDSRTIELERPQVSELAANDCSFTEVLESRRSIREHGEVPIDLPRLGEFLFRSARVVGKAGWRGQEIALRPYPSAGGLHELEIYPLINRCNGLPQGVYRYDPFGHRLIHRADPGPGTATLIGECYRATQMQTEPQVLVLVAARFAPVNDKYDSIAYSLILKNTGCLLQTMHLVSNAMGLAGCVLGGGNSDLFCKTVGSDFWKEGTVGEFLLGSRRVVRQRT